MRKQSYDFRALGCEAYLAGMLAVALLRASIREHFGDTDLIHRSKTRNY
jgi:hypothetical protein